MARIQIQLDETTYALANQRAYTENKSLDAIVRDALDQFLTTSHKQPSRLEDFTFIGSGQSNTGTLHPLSEKHDEALAEDFAR